MLDLTFVGREVNYLIKIRNIIYIVILYKLLNKTIN